MTEESLFHEALARADDRERAAFLDGACAGNRRLRAAVEALLAAHHAPGRFLDLPAEEIPTVGADLDPTSIPATGEYRVAPGAGPGVVIAGRYTLQEKIGEGGMGDVWVALQTEPIRRRVALKLIRPGMDSRAVLARFEQERQALALMDHPNIARVFDGGLTPHGQPFFVMELVNGLPLTKFCDEARLTPRDRLEAFVPICQAVQHAHQKGVVHRDLKPANILVTIVDGRPVPKVIDFGVAKATAGKITDESMATQFGAIVGTLEYMAPEQAGFSGADVDTRADIYSLGVILYELLTGLRPIDAARVKQAAMTEMIRVIREVEPSKPSTRLSTDEALPSLAAVRQTEPRKLARMLQGDLDWVVMKCLEKPRDRRYETANALARDVRRYLDGDPVEAGPPTARYRLGKFARRHRVALATASAFAALLVLGTAVSVALTIRATQAERSAWIKTRLALEAEGRAGVERDRAVLAEARARAEGERAGRSAADASSVLTFFQDRVLSAARPLGLKNGLGRDATIRQAINAAEPTIRESFQDRPLVEASIRQVIGQTYAYLGEWTPAAAQFERAAALRMEALGTRHPDTLTSQASLGHNAVTSGDYRRGIPLLERAWEGRKAVLGPDHADTLSLQKSLAWAYGDTKEHERAISLYQDALRRQSARLGPDHPATLEAQYSFGNIYWKAGQLERARPLLERSFELRLGRLGPDHPDTLTSQGNLGNFYVATGDPKRALPLLERALAGRAKALGPDHIYTLRSMANLARALARAGQLPGALDLYDQTVRAQARALGPDHPDTIMNRERLAGLRRDVEESHALNRVVVKGPGRPASDVEPDQPEAFVRRGDPIWDTAIGQSPRDLPQLEWRLAGYETQLGTSHPVTLANRAQVAQAYREAGQPDRAIPHLEMILEARRDLLGPDEPDTLRTQLQLATCCREAGRPGRGLEIFEQVLAIRERKLGPSDRGTLATMNELAEAHQAHGNVPRAEQLFRTKLAREIEKLGEGDIEVARTRSALGLSLLKRGQYAESEPIFRSSSRAREAQQPDAWQTFSARSMLGGALLGLGRYAEADPLLVSGYEGMKAREAKIPAAGKVRLAEAARRVVDLYEAWRKPERATAWRSKLNLWPDLPANVFAEH